MTATEARPVGDAAIEAVRRHDAKAAGHATGSRRRLRLAAVAGIVTLGVVVSAVTAERPWLILLVAALVLAVGLTLREPAAVPVVAVPALIVINRVGGEAGGLSVSDLVLFIALWPALLLGARPFTTPLRSLLWGSAVYQALVLFTVVANPYAANATEWFHSWLLVAGALLVGWAAGAAGHGRLALGLYVAAAAVVAVVTCATWLLAAAAGRFDPVYLDQPLMMHKNYLGCVLAFAALIVYARPSWLRWNDAWCMALLGLFVAAVLASQSRQAMIGLALAVAVVSLRPDPARRRSKVVLVVVLAVAVVVVALVRDQIDSGDQHNSANQRLTWFGQSLAIWEQYPVFGAGLRWWYTDRFPERFQPPNAEFEVLSSAGVVGLVGFGILVLVSLVVLWRVDPRFGTLAFAIVLMRFTQGQFDLFWVAAQVSIPFAVAGVCLGAQAHAGAHPPGRHALPIDARLEAAR
ncbi:O-antigen ligase family protein [Cellulomonas chengniuliangii]|uniref:O-antigen ligase family protein n=1 Tax=Cellulomonas chengniuliangii TaxID=2968084 RepID=UPI001D0E6E45|nr:O-antigen ligase family protein [Cellulomonas chengniuliangii]MCC2316517.1 O-antigen ligase family protein [Cellulomonas chengniuliangii]